MDLDESVAAFEERGYIYVPGAVDLSNGSLMRSFFDRSMRLHGLVDENGFQVVAEGVTSTPPRTVVDISRAAPGIGPLVNALVDGRSLGIRPVRLSDAFIVSYRTHDPAKSRWHIDGDFFRHFLDSPEQALLVFVLWTDCRAGEGATEAAPQGVDRIVKYLEDRPAGEVTRQMPIRDLVAGVPTVELTGTAGDVYLLHPLTPHRGRPNPSGPPRIISNPVVSVTRPLRLGKGAVSAVERVTTRHLTTPFTAPAPHERETFTPSRLSRWSDEGPYQPTPVNA